MVSNYMSIFLGRYHAMLLHALRDQHWIEGILTLSLITIYSLRKNAKQLAHRYHSRCWGSSKHSIFWFCLSMSAARTLLNAPAGISDRLALPEEHQETGSSKRKCLGTNVCGYALVWKKCGPLGSRLWVLSFPANLSHGFWWHSTNHIVSMFRDPVSGDVMQIPFSNHGAKSGFHARHGTNLISFAWFCILKPFLQYVDVVDVGKGGGNNKKKNLHKKSCANSPRNAWCNSMCHSQHSGPLGPNVWMPRVSLDHPHDSSRTAVRLMASEVREHPNNRHKKNSLHNVAQ